MQQGKDKVRILIANGVNLDLLGTREPHLYGTTTLSAIESRMRSFAPECAKLCGFVHCELTFFQSNSEEAFLAKLSQGDWDGALINPGAWTHTSLALADRLVALQLPFVEIHLSNLSKREKFRQRSYAAPHALGVVYGLGAESYLAGLLGLLTKLQR